MVTEREQRRRDDSNIIPPTLFSLAGKSLQLVIHSRGAAGLMGACQALAPETLIFRL